MYAYSSSSPHLAMTSSESSTQVTQVQYITCPLAHTHIHTTSALVNPNNLRNSCFISLDLLSGTLPLFRRVINSNAIWSLFVKISGSVLLLVPNPSTRCRHVKSKALRSFPMSAMQLSDSAWFVKAENPVCCESRKDLLRWWCICDVYNVLTTKRLDMLCYIILIPGCNTSPPTEASFTRLLSIPVLPSSRFSHPRFFYQVNISFYFFGISNAPPNPCPKFFS